MALTSLKAATVTLTSASTAYPLSSVPIAANSVLIKAPSTNPGTVYIGGADVNTSNAGYPLVAGNTLSLGQDTKRRPEELWLHKVFVMASVTGCTVQILYDIQVSE